MFFLGKFDKICKPTNFPVSGLENSTLGLALLE